MNRKQQQTTKLPQKAPGQHPKGPSHGLHNLRTLINRKNLSAGETAQQPRAISSQSKHAGASPLLIKQGSVSTIEELITRAKHHIGKGEASRINSFHAAADDIARACDQGATQREVAEGVGKSGAWVNRLLKWREGGCVGAPFADKVVQGVNKEPAALEPPSIEPAPLTVIGETNAIGWVLKRWSMPKPPWHWIPRPRRPTHPTVTTFRKSLIGRIRSARFNASPKNGLRFHFMTCS